MIKLSKIIDKEAYKSFLDDLITEEYVDGLIKEYSEEQYEEIECFEENLTFKTSTGQDYTFDKSFVELGGSVLEYENSIQINHRKLEAEFVQVTEFETHCEMRDHNTGLAA